MGSKGDYMTDEYVGGDEYDGGFLVTLIKIIFFPFFVAGRLLGIW